MFVIGASSYDESMTQLSNDFKQNAEQNLNFSINSLPFGYIRTANGKSHSISWTNFRLIHLAEDPSLVAPKAMTFQFKANKKMYSATVHFQKRKSVPIGGQKPIAWIANLIPVEIGKILYQHLMKL